MRTFNEKLQQAHEDIISCGFIDLFQQRPDLVAVPRTYWKTNITFAEYYCLNYDSEDQYTKSVALDDYHHIAEALTLTKQEN